ncbi:hypothetical protein GCM10022252_75540 [Streptosporangium oxazolinicum]|uniref:Prohead serine protease domain-containing protein n=1 Tax=Streptosporangium oxazolinicum TaxID=909287 RepID=A0ABP8BKN2_9ACTN
MAGQAVLELERKNAVATVPTGVIAALDEGVVEAIVSITNHVDNVGDLILPGAYEESLRTRTPKGLFSHDDKVWVARTEEIVELMPGDPRLVAATSGGKPWPAGAGALWVKARFNLDTVAGREAFSNVKFFGRELEWSIGYRVPTGGSKRGRDGVRRIKQVDLFEYSLVMFGAASETRTLSVKSHPWQESKADRSDAGPGVMVALMLPPELAEQLAVADGLPATDLHVTLAYLGKGLDEEQLTLAADTVSAVAASAAPLAGTIGGLGAFPPGDDGVPVFATVDVPGLEVLRQAVVDALKAAGLPVASEHGFTPHTTLTYLKPGEPLPAPLPAREVSFAEVVLAQDDQRTAFPLGAASPGVGSEWDTLFNETAEEAKNYGLDVARAAGYPIPMSFEEIRVAICSAFDAWSGGWIDGKYVSVLATFSDVAIACVKHPDDTESFYRVPWSFTEQGWVRIGEPIVVTVSVTGIPDGAPLAAMLEDAAAAVKHSGLELEVKAGRVLSAPNAKRLRAAVASLLAVLRGAGLGLDDLEEERDQSQDTEELPLEATIHPDSTAPSALPSEMKGLVLTQEELDAAADIEAFLQECAA